MGKGQKQKRDKKNATTVTIGLTPQSAESTAPGPSVQPPLPAETTEKPILETKQDEPKEEDVGGLGLDLGGGKKRQRKKKGQGDAAAPSSSAQTLISSVPLEEAPVQTADVTAAAPSGLQSVTLPGPSESKVTPQAKQEDTKDDDGGLGLGLAGGKRRQRKKKGQEHASAEGAPIPPSAAPPMVSGPPPKELSPVPVQTALAPLQSVPSPQPQFPSHPMAYGPPPSQFTSASAPVGQGRGRGWSQGRGRGAVGQPPGAMLTPGAPVQPGPQVSAPAAGPFWGTVPTGQVPVQPIIPRQQMQQAGGVPMTPSAGVPVTQAAGPPPKQQSPRPSDKICLFKIPKKIEKPTLPVLKRNVITNYLPMKIKPSKIYRYDVSFKPERPTKFFSKVFIKIKQKHFPQTVIAFDQIKNCYTVSALPCVKETERFTTTTDFQDPNGRTINYEVSFKFTGIVDFETIIRYMREGSTSLNPPTEAIQCVDVVLRQGTLESYVKAGRQFFKRPSNPIALGDGLEIWTGLFQSAIFTSKPFINIDVAHKGFPIHQPLIKTLMNEFRLDPRKSLEQQDYRSSRSRDSFKLFLKNLRVVANIGGAAGGAKREFIVNDVADPATKLMFDYQEGEQRPVRISVADYFARVKNCRLQYPNLNCLWVGARDKKIYYPIELLEVAYGQTLNKQLNEFQLASMVRQAATPPSDRMRKIQDVKRDMNYTGNNLFKSFGLEISDQFHSVDAKILKPPTLEIGPRGLKVEPRAGVWNTDSFLKAESLVSWGYINLETMPDTIDFENIVSLVSSVGRRLGMNVSAPSMRLNIQMRELSASLQRAQQQDIKFVFIFVGTRGRDYYHQVKKVAELDVGILTQCIKEATAAKRMNFQTMKNILLKVNSKLMGVNQALDKGSLPQCLREGGVMVVGADVTHPSPDQSSIPSIAAVTASIDEHAFIYNIELSIQTPRKEMIVEFESMMVDHFQVYRQRMGQLPRKIFVFRDGVSEGQFAQVMNSELQAVHNAYARLTGPAGRRPEVLFLLVQKRHHTRLFQQDKGQIYNVSPGTVVDTEIVHASELDFYLVSHAAIKGTARPTRYHAVCNDGGIPADQVEQLTYYLCHLYSRCTRAVSYPTPTYYAHLACLRARSLTHDRRFDNAKLERQPERLHVLNKMLNFSRMFFV